jgi:pantoate--beta-alanine ligase
MALQITTTIDAVRVALGARREHGRIGFVPTMGALHAGHASLVERARRECATVAVSIFVNPLQFDRQDDLTHYPRPFDADIALCEKLGVDVVFAPTPAVMYPRQQACTIDVGHLADHLCGRFRPGHFSGVATVVLKLLEIVQPDAAYFGEKDAQQLAIIRRLVSDFAVPVEIVGGATVREPDGLALSSRNQHLNAEDRVLAPALHQALLAARDAVMAGASDAAAVRARATAAIPADERLRLEYLEFVDPDDFQPVDTITGEVVAAGALWVGHTRLIDNLRLSPPAQP